MSQHQMPNAPKPPIKYTVEPKVRIPSTIQRTGSRALDIVLLIACISTPLIVLAIGLTVLAVKG